MTGKQEKFLNRLVGVFKKKFGNSLVGVLLFGSHSAGFDTPTSDIDIWVILRNYRPEQLSVLKKIHDKYRPEGLSLTVKWIDELNFAKSSYASHKGYGGFIIWELHRAITLYGINPYKKINVKKEEIFSSVVIRIEKMLIEYRKLLIKNIKLDLSIQKDIFKHVIRATRYMVLAAGQVPKPANLFKLLFDYYPEALSVKEANFLIDKHGNNDFSGWKLGRSELLLCLKILRNYYLTLLSATN